MSLDARVRGNLGTIAVIASAVSYGTLSLFGKLVTDAGLGVAALLFWRFLAGGAILWALVAIMRVTIPKGRHAVVAVAIGLLFAAMSTTYFITLVRVGAAYAVLMLYAYPAVVIAIEHVLGNRINRRRFIAVLLAIGGVALLVHPGQRVDLAGLAIGLLSALFYGIYLVITSRVMQKASPLATSALIVSALAPIFGVAAVVTRTDLHLTPHTATLIGMVSALSTAAPIALLGWGIARIGAPRAAVLGTLEPLTGVLLVTIFAGERLDALQIVGGIMLMASSVVPDKPVAVALEG